MAEISGMLLSGAVLGVAGFGLTEAYGSYTMDKLARANYVTTYELHHHHVAPTNVDFAIDTVPTNVSPQPGQSFAEHFNTDTEHFVGFGLFAAVSLGALALSLKNR